LGSSPGARGVGNGKMGEEISGPFTVVKDDIWLYVVSLALETVKLDIDEEKSSYPRFVGFGGAIGGM